MNNSAHTYTGSVIRVSSSSEFHNNRVLQSLSFRIVSKIYNKDKYKIYRYYDEMVEMRKSILNCIDKLQYLQAGQKI